VAHKQHNPADDFDLMLQQHLKRGGAPVAPCAGFDADTANAYVERALSASSQLQFEKHLAGCAACRRHVVALARLSDALAPTAVATPIAPAQVAEPFWSRWQNTVVQWFDFSGWNLGWTAATGTACAVLLAALGTGVWWRAQAPQPAQMALAGRAVSDAAATQSILTNNAVVLPNGSLADTAKLASAELVKTTLPPDASVATAMPQAGLLMTETVTAGRQTIPQPAATPSFPVTSGFVALTSAPESRKLAVEPSAPIITAPPTPPPAFNLPATAISLNHLSGNQPSGIAPVRMVGDAPMRSSSQLVLMPGEPEQKELVNDLLLPGPRRNRAREEAPAKNGNESSKASSNRELLKALKGRTFGFMPMKDADKDAKDIDARTKEADLKEAQEQTKLLMKRLNGHVFFFDHGFWIDEEYTSETKLPIKRLTRGSQEYQQILIQNPSLEQFFQLGQVIVVWKGIVYEVHK
jgi:hypothetical protein